MSKGSATAILAIALILAVIATAGLYSTGNMTGAAASQGSSSNLTLLALVILIIVIAGTVLYLFYKSKSSTKKTKRHSKEIYKRLALPFAIIILIIAGAALFFGMPQLAKFAAPVAPAATSVTVTLNPVADTTASEAEPSKTDFGWYGSFMVRSGDMVDEWVYIKFDLSSIPAGSTIDSAKLRLYADLIDFSGARTYALNDAAGSWSESTLTWNNKPAVGAAVTTLSVSSIGWKEWDVTSNVQAKINGGVNNGWVITDAEQLRPANPMIAFDSKEGRPLYIPQLVISYRVVITSACLDPCPRYDQQACNNYAPNVCQWGSTGCVSVRSSPNSCANQHDRSSCEDNSQTLCCWDGDNDGYPTGMYQRCSPVAWSRADCNDANPNVNPGKVEGVSAPGTCSDGLDNDCQAGTDCADPGCATDPACMPLLTVSMTGSGNIVSNDDKIYCGSKGTLCSTSYAVGQQVILTAFPDDGFSFQSWGWDCASSGSNPTCTLTMSAKKEVTAAFTTAYPSCILSANPSSGTGPFGSSIGVSYSNLPSPVPSTISVGCGTGGIATASGCTGTTGSCTTPAYCEYPLVDITKTFIPGAQIGNMICAPVTITDYSTGQICSIKLDLSPNPAPVGASVIATATVYGQACGKIKICAPNRSTLPRYPGENGQVTEVFVPPADFNAAPGTYSFTAALVDKGGNCTEPSPFADTETLTVTQLGTVTVAGKLTDQNNNGISNTAIELCNIKDTASYRVTTDSNGAFSVPNIPIDHPYCARVTELPAGYANAKATWPSEPGDSATKGNTTYEWQIAGKWCKENNTGGCATDSRWATWDVLPDDQFYFTAQKETGPACNGTPKLEFMPSIATINHATRANVSNLTNCDGNEVTFNCTPANATQPALSISSCTYSGNTGCISTFTAPGKKGNYSCTANVSKKLSTTPLNVVDCIMQNPILTIEPTTPQKGARGDALLYMATVGNNNTCISTFSLNVTTCQKGWSCDLYDKTLDVDEGDSADASLVITSPASNIGVGNYMNQLTASIYGSSNYNSTIDVGYTILKSCERTNPTLNANKVSQSGSIGQERVYSVRITNLDKCSSFYSLNLSCRTGWVCNLDTPDIYLFDREAADLAVTLMPGTGTATGDYNFTLTAANSYDETKAANTTLKYSVTALNANQSVPCQMFGCFKVGDGNCDTILGENITNSPNDCAPPKTEAPPVCGNKIVETGEDCDGSSDAKCPGLCNADCTCPFIIGDNVCDTAAGESSAISPDCAKKAGSASLVILLVAIFGAIGVTGYYLMRRRGMLGSLAATHGVETTTPGVNLDTAVNSMLSEGYNPEEIHSSLEAGGWPHGKIESAMESAQKDQEALGKLAEQQGVAAPVEKARAAKYVKKCLTEGYDPTQIRTAMISSGWPADAVDGVISKQTAKHIQSHAEKAGVAEPSDDIHALKGYVKKELNEGHTSQDIKKALKKAGWSDSDIKQAFGG